MVCIHCGGNTHVFNSRPQKRTNTVWRRRQCLNCGSVISTCESADLAAAVRVLDSKGALTPFLRDKLLLSLYKSLGHRSTALTDAGALTATIITKVTPLAQDGALSSQATRQAATVALNRFDKVAAAHYLAFHK